MPGGFSSDLVLAWSPPSRSEDKAGLTARTRRRLRDLPGMFLLPPSPCCITSSFSTRSPRDLAARDSSTSHDNDLGAVPIRELPPGPPLFEDCSPRRTRRRRRRCSGSSRGRTRSHRFDSPWRVFMRCVIGESRRGQGRLYLGAKLEGRHWHQGVPIADERYRFNETRSRDRVIAIGPRSAIAYTRNRRCPIPASSSPQTRRFGASPCIRRMHAAALRCTWPARETIAAE